MTLIKLAVEMSAAFRWTLQMTFLTCGIVVVCNGQPLGRQSIFAHNDYLKPQPFHAAYAERVGFIEVDVFLKDDKLMVAHTRAEISSEHDIRTMYLNPLSDQIRSNAGYAYRDNALTLHLMVDIKTEALSTLRKLVEVLADYPDLTNCRNLFVTISGNMPPPMDWAQVPSFIYFDGRIGQYYDDEQLKRVPLISASFRTYSSWKGKGKMKAEDRARLVEAITAVHLLQKPIRFWATPDTPKAWQELTLLEVEIINTDNVAAVVLHLNSSLK